MNDTIVALATPPIKSALAIIRVSGPDSFDIVSNMFSKDILATNKRTAYVGKILNNNSVIDDVVLIAYKGPRSFTGEDMVEIICHGSVLIANEIISLLISRGARMATNGEYSQRSYLNQKIDLVQAEAINDVINAITNEAKSISLLSLNGETSAKVQQIKTKIADLLSLIEVNIDYPEYEDIEVANKEKIICDCNEIQALIDNMIEDGEKAKLIVEGIKVAIVGKPNVGKSSLLNALLNEDKAIVTDVAGTTRDVVEGTVNLDGIVLRLLDTAGIRDTDDKVESIGVSKSINAFNDADLVIVVLDTSKIDEEDEKILELTKNHNRIIVYNKKDLLINKEKNLIYISAIDKDINELKKAIMEKYQITPSSFNKPALHNARQIGLLKAAKLSLDQATKDAENDLTVDLISVSLSNAYHQILAVLGEDVDVDLSKEIFKRFCVGK